MTNTGGQVWFLPVFKSPIVSTSKEPVTLYLDLPIHPPYDVCDSYDAIPMMSLPITDGVTLGWKVSPMQFVDGTGKDVSFDCPNIVITGGQNLGNKAVSLYVVAAFYDVSDRLLSCQTSEHCVQPWERYDVPGLWSRFPFSISEISRVSLRITISGCDAKDRIESPFPISSAKPFKKESKREWKRADHVVGTYGFQKWNPGKGELLYATEPLTKENKLRFRLERKENQGFHYLAIVPSTNPVPSDRKYDNLIQYVLYDESGRICHGGSCMGMGNHGEYRSLVPILPEILQKESLSIEYVVWEGPSGTL
ncbi:hypothetical protein [Leptospira levettii]|uniref:hypothetical protein n=1 Tax=Leptospira levettii TaxID=2023178 RepID=UPI001082CCC7|nr:hypothetical protein [Leptospira levettii]TGL00983.1 hypothetical protein EHQ34_02000 [Leptospira levettii]TGL11211.1 hypothetical protein EHQ42_15975 [Leptospira levettii]